MSSASTGGTEGSSPASSPASAASHAMAAPKYGTLVPNRIFVGGISANTSEGELAQLFSSYGNVKATKIILDRAGVSKGYGFVTFETEEEAKRLQQESECIILRERKLNIAPAIKKQPFSRSFDGGSGSPPAVPTSPYYYANGMGLPYQNGLTFYNTGAPAPGAPLAPPTDPAALYQAASVFGPQAASAHQTFAPMMYPCPAPSLYMPQQYQYSPMPYESYYTGAAGASPYIYTAASSGTTNGTTVGASGNQNTGGTGATSSPTNHHFYPGTGGPPNHHHHHHHHHPQTVPSSPTPNHQGLDQVYYSFTAGPPPPSHLHQHQAQSGQGPPIQHGNIGHGDQQLLLYTTDCQQPVNSDSQTAQQQEETRSTSSHSQNDISHHQQSQTTILEPSPSTPSHSNSTNPPTTPLMSLMPLKYPITPRYTNYTHPLSIHPSAMTPTPPAVVTADTSYQTDSEDTTTPPMHCRTILYTPVFIQTPYTPSSLFPTPSNPPNHHQANLQKSPYSTLSRMQNGYSILSNIHQTHYPKSQHQQQQQQQTSTKIIQNQRKNSASSSYVITRGFDRSSILSNSSGRSPQTSFTSSKSNMEMNCSSTRRNLKNGNFGLKNVSGTTNLGPGDDGNGSDKPTTSPPPAPYSPMTRPLPNFSPTNLQVQFYSAQGRYNQGTVAAGQSQSLQNSSQPSIHQPQRRFSSIQQQQQQQQQQHNNSSQINPTGRKIPDKFGAAVGAQGLVVRNNKYKVNGLNSKVLDEGIGGAGDAQGARIQMTPPPPPGTPRNTQDNQITETCHQMQTLTL